MNLFRRIARNVDVIDVIMLTLFVVAVVGVLLAIERAFVIYGL